jgi:hypothetical protein
MKRAFILGLGVDRTNYQSAVQGILDWALRGESRYVCVANVHMVMEAYDDAEFRQIVNAADLVTPDGMPLVWVMRLQGLRQQERVYGPTLTQFVLEAANREGIPVGFYGSTPQTLESSAPVWNGFFACSLNPGASGGGISTTTRVLFCWFCCSCSGYAAIRNEPARDGWPNDGVLTQVMGEEITRQKCFLLFPATLTLPVGI